MKNLTTKATKAASRTRTAMPGTVTPELDLSAGFVPKPAAGEPAKEEMTPDSFIAQQAKSASSDELTFDSFMAQQVPTPTAAPAEDKFDFRPEPPAPDGNEPQPTDGKPAEITWWWVAPTDMPALQLLHFQAEVAAGCGMYLPELPIPGAIAVARQVDKIVGGFVVEESVVVALIGMSPEVFESAGAIISKVVAQARNDGTRFLQVSLPPPLAATLDGALQKVGFKLVDDVQYRLDTGVEESNCAKRN